ncbi:MAG: NAD-dependent epimerase/dehydratase family protein [Chloroflexota bacterium]
MERQRPTVLVTGAAGRIGSAFRLAMGGMFRFRLADLAAATLADTPGAGHEAVRLDIRDADAVRAACAGADAVLHLAADPSPEADWETSLLPVNVQGTLHVLRGAAQAGCARVVLASSLHVVGGYPLDRPIPHDAPPRPANLYGASKAAGEALGAVFAARGMTVIAVRIGAYDAPWLHDDPPPGAGEASAYVSARDLNGLLARCLTWPVSGFHTVYGVSGNRPNRVDLAGTRALLGYAPVDDGFEALGVLRPGAGQECVAPRR